MPSSRVATISILALIAGAVALRADVFMRIGRRPRIALERAGGRLVYQADVRVNGQPANLAMLGFDQPADTLASPLARKLGLPEPSMGKADGAHIAGVAGGRELDLILLPGLRPGITLAMLIDRRAGDGATGKADMWTDWSGLPRPPAATPIFTAANLATRTTLAVATTPAEPETLHAEMRSRMEGEGWIQAAPRGRNGGLALYSRGNDILLVFTQPADPNTDDGQTRITLLQRSGHAP